jgi:hypothetical protein
VRTYRGIREGNAATVSVDGRPLNPRLDLWNHSPSGFEWGYSGSGPAQLALALLADHLGNDDRALKLHQDFKRAVVANLSFKGWAFTSDQIQLLVAALESSPLHQETAAINGHARNP